MGASSDERHLAIRVMLLPKDTNAHGTIFGGVILSQIDLAGAVEARRHTEHSVVTVAMNAWSSSSRCTSVTWSRSTRGSFASDAPAFE